MASSARKLKTSPENETQLQLLYGDDAITKYWSSSLFNTVYLRHDISDKHSCWKNEDDLDYQNFMNTIRNLAAEYKNREKELSNWSETETINNWVKHVLQALGWTNHCTGVQNPFLEETSFRYDGKTYRTDILIVDHPKEKQYVNQAKGDDKLREARRSILMPVEVKYWQRLEEYRQGTKEEKGRTDNESDDISRTTTPNEQTIQYMDILKKDWGILTDGAKWRLFNTELSSEDAERFYEFNFFTLFQALSTEETEADSIEIVDAAKYFYYFFSKFAFFPKTESERPFVDEVLQYSKKYVNKVEEDIKDRFVKAMNIACNGLYKFAKSEGQSHDQTVLRNVSESTLFNVLFIKSLESRGILPMASTDYKKISLTSIIDKIERFDPEKDDFLNTRELERAFKKGNGNSFSYDGNGTELHDRIIRLTNVVHKGTSQKDNFGFEINGFKESIFSNTEWEIFKTCKLKNSDWVRILFEIGYAESESLSRKYQQIPYAFFTPRQLGSIYESFLEFKLDRADTDMIFLKGQWIEKDLKNAKVLALDCPKVKKGDLFFTPDNEDRKVSGSYYTPDHVVKMMVQETIFEKIQNLSSAELLKFSVLDPSMGSGHFICESLRFLARAYVEKVENETSEQITLNEAKKKVLHSCIFGVDINDRAVKLAKMSLWLESANSNTALEDLNDQLKCEDSLDEKKSFKWVKGGGFSAIVGNPPYVSSKNVKTVKRTDEEAQGQDDLYIRFVENILKGKIPLSEHGSFSFIIPDPFLIRSNAKNARKMIIEEHALEKCVHIDGVFKAGVSNVILFITRNGKSNSKVNFYRLDGKEDKDYLLNTCQLPKTEKLFIHNQKTFEKTEENKWTYLLSEDDTEKFHLFEQHGIPLENLYTDRRGEEIGKKDIDAASTREKGINILLGGEGITKFGIRESAKVNIKKSLVKKNLSLYTGRKIIMQKSSPYFVASVDESSDSAPLIVPQSIYILKSKAKDDIYCEHLICGIMNSDLANRYLFNRVTGYKLLQPHFEQKDIKSFPIPKLDKNDFGEYKKLVKEYLSKLKKAEKLNLKGIKDAVEFAAVTAATSEFIAALWNGQKYSRDPSELLTLLNEAVEKMYDAAICKKLQKAA